jgi:hypothetical protein
MSEEIKPDQIWGIFATIRFSLLSSSLLSRNVKVEMYKSIILPRALYGCETWSLTLTEVHRLRVFENWVLRSMFGSKTEEVTGEWRKVCNEELHNLCSFPNIIRHIKSRRLRWVGHLACMGEERKVYKVLVGKPEGKIPLVAYVSCTFMVCQVPHLIYMW